MNLLLALLLLGQETVTTNRVTIEVPTEKLAEVEKTGKVLEIREIVRDKFPKPEIKISGAGEQPKGELINLEVQEERPSDVISATYEWKLVGWLAVQKGDKWVWELQEKVLKLWPDKKSAVTAIGANGEFLVYLSVTYLYPDNLLTSSTVTEKLSIQGGPTPPEPVPPQPNPTPKPVDPVFPVGKYDLSNVSFKLKKDTGLTDRAAQSLVETLQTVSNEIATNPGRFTGTAPERLEQALTYNASINANGLNNKQIPKAEWEQFTTKWGEIVFNLYDQNKLLTPEDLKVAIDESRTGLTPTR